MAKELLADYSKDQLIAELINRQTFVGVVIFHREDAKMGRIAPGELVVTKSPPLTREGVDALLDSARLLTPGLFGDQSGDADGVGRLPDAVGLRHDAGGVIRVGQSRISLDLVVDQFEDGATPEEMVRAYDTLRLADVYAAIAYYLRHRDKVASYLERRRAEAEALQQRIEAERPPISRDELVRRQREAEHAHAPTRK